MRQVLMGVVIAGLAMGTAYAQGGPPEGRLAGGARAGRQRLDLSPEQRTEMQKLRAAFVKEHIRQRAELQIVRLELGELLAAPTIDDKAVLAKAQTISDLQAARTKRMIEQHLAMAKVLTPEQRQTAKAFGIGRRGPHGPGQGREFRGHWRRHAGGAGPDARAGWDGEDGPLAANDLDLD